jgi:peptide/nickel transport system substrate-binding protein
VPATIPEKERRVAMTRFSQIIAAVLLAASAACAFAQGELHMAFKGEPTTFNPLLVEEQSGETIRYMTGGTLVRVNRLTQQVEPALATSWKISKDGKTFRFTLRPGVKYSDGTPFSAEDVAYTVQQMMDPKLHSPVGDAFRTGSGTVSTRVISPTEVEISFPAVVANALNAFDTVAIMSAKSPQHEMAVLGPFYVADHKAGSYVLLKKNQNYWKKDTTGKQLPFLDSVRIDVQTNTDLEFIRFQRGEMHLINSVGVDYFDKLNQVLPGSARDVGLSNDVEMFWFNQAAKSQLPDYKKKWFTSDEFRRAISMAINRDDLARVVYHGHAHPAMGPVSRGNKMWANTALKPHAYDPAAAVKLLTNVGFRMDGSTLRDSAGNAVEFSIATNAGNKARERMATMIQQDLAKMGIKVSVAPMDFPSLIERMTSTFNYDAILLALLHDDPDPNSEMNVWMSSGENHQWNPAQKSPATAWEKQIDELMQKQASSTNHALRKKYWDQVQAIAWQQEPFIYLVTTDTLVAISPKVQNAKPAVLRPQTFWNIDELKLTQ